MCKVRMLGICVVLTVFCLFTGCGKTDTTSKKSVMNISGKWSPPPVYSGNPFIAGGLEVSNRFVFGTFALYNYLTGEYTNYLAESIDIEDDVLTIKLKQGFYWQDGTPFTSRDVLVCYTLKDAQDIIAHISIYVKSIETPDDYTVIYNLEENKTDSMLINLLTNETQDIQASKYEKWMDTANELIKYKKDFKKEFEEYYENDGKVNQSIVDKYSKANGDFNGEIGEFKDDYTTVGYGPYKISKVTPSDIILDKVDKFPNIENIKIDQIHVHQISNNNIAWTILRTGDLDFISVVTPPDMVESILNNNKNIELITGPEGLNIGLWLNSDIYPFNELKFRQALAYIIDRDKAREMAVYYSKAVEYITGMVSFLEDKWISTEGLNKYDVNHKKS